MKPESPVVVDVRAIDVGHFSVKVSLGRKIKGDTSEISTILFPSVAPRLPAGQTIQSVLQSRPDGTIVDVDGVYYFVGRDVSLFTSGREPREVLPQYSETANYRAMTLGALQYIFNDAGAKDELIIRNLVVGLPLTTYSAQRKSLTERFSGEHLLPDPSDPGSKRRVTIERVTPVVQPQGALVSHGLNAGRQQSHNQQWIAVIDAGGGTLDWYVARGLQSNWSRSGAFSTGMLACAYAVADKINANWRDDFEICQRIDNAIRNQDASFTVSGRTYMLAEYETSIESVLKEATEKMVARLGSLETIDVFLFTGGGAKVFMAYFQKKYPQLSNILYIDEEPVFSNVKGFQLIGELLAGETK